MKSAILRTFVNGILLQNFVQSSENFVKVVTTSRLLEGTLKMAKTRKTVAPRQWVLFRSTTSGELWISNQKGTPIYELERLSHYKGAFRSIDEACKEGLKILRREMEVALEQMDQLLDQSRELERKNR
jgi:hypothetical protein